MRSMLEYFWSDWKVGLVVAAGMAAGAGLISAWLTPRGAVLADEWFDMLDAPSKEKIVFEGSRHRPNFEQPGRFAEVMRDVLQMSLRK